ncbi:hypothetical protein ACFQ15_02690 [Sphingomonas hankookensis]|uniref:hypothetical protein n=1 Tax=Sphingomonas hankookensis TaxID=563996 RepID=UPI001F566FD3|nr:hypothetical protein [Sphingomonas hankookensis]
MADFFMKLTPEERRLFGELMAMRDAHDRMLKTADEVATDLIKRFVTRHGKLADTVAHRLGGQPPYGRGDVLLDLLRALTGPHPLPQAWIEAKANGGFDIAFYRAKRKRDEERSTGSAGVFLPRMVAQHRDGVNRVRVSPAGNAALYTEAAMMTTAMVHRDLQQAVCARQALGPAWVVGLAVHPLPSQTRRQMDAMADNPAYVAALGQAVAEVTAKFATPDLVERTNEDITHSLPRGADIETFFIGHDERQLADTIDALVAATEQAALSGHVFSPRIDEAVERLLAAARQQRGKEHDKDEEAAIERQAEAATRYLDTPVDPDEDLTEHHARLRLLLPELMSNRTRLERGAHIVRSVNCTVRAGVYGESSMTGDARIDAILTGIADRIEWHAMTVGPPPPGTPLEHLPIFASAAIAAFMTGHPNWKARQQWHDAGLLPATVEPVGDIAPLVRAAFNGGLAAVDLEAMHRTFG